MADITSGLVAHWKLDETSGTSAADSSGNGHTVAMARDFTVTTTPGKILRALQCDGTNDTGTNNATAITNGASVLTLAAWAKTSATNKTVCMVSTNADAFASRVRLSIGTVVANKYSLAVLIDGETVQEVYTSDSFADGAWHHIVGVVNLASDTIAIYADGTSQTVIGTPAFTGTAWPASNPARLRLSGVGGSGRWNGALDDVRIYSRALSADDVAALYAYTGEKYLYTELYPAQLPCGLFHN